MAKELLRKQRKVDETEADSDSDEEERFSRARPIHKKLLITAPVESANFFESLLAVQPLHVSQKNSYWIQSI